MLLNKVLDLSQTISQVLGISNFLSCSILLPKEEMFDNWLNRVDLISEQGLTWRTIQNSNGIASYKLTQGSENIKNAVLLESITDAGLYDREIDITSLINVGIIIPELRLRASHPLWISTIFQRNFRRNKLQITTQDFLHTPPKDVKAWITIPDLLKIEIFEN